MDRSNDVMQQARTQVDVSLYIWGARGQDILTKSNPEDWARSMETENGGYTREQNVQRVMARYEKLRRQGLREILCFDCSGFIFWLFSANELIDTRTNAAGLFRQCLEKRRDELRAGDLVFVHSGQKISHVGIYAGSDRVIHSKGRDVGVVEEAIGKHNWNRYGRWPGIYDDEPQPEPGEKYVKAKGTVHIRTGPGSRYERIGTSKDGEKFPYLGERDGWYQIRYDPHPEAWISGKAKYTEVVG